MVFHLLNQEIPLVAYLLSEGWDEFEASVICSADALGFDMLLIDSLIKAMGREHENSTIFTLPNIALKLI